MPTDRLSDLGREAQFEVADDQYERRVEDGLAPPPPGCGPPSPEWMREFCLANGLALRDPGTPKRSRLRYTTKDAPPR